MRARRLVDEVDGLVRQLPVGDVAMRKPCCGNDGRIGDVHRVVQFVALLEAAQDRHGVLHVRLVHLDFLEAALESRVLLDVQAILVERGRADAVQFAPSEGGLEHVAGVQGTLRLASAHHRVQFVDEQDDAALLLAEFVQHGLQAFLELPPELGAGDQRAHVEGKDALALQPLRHLAVQDALGEALDDGRLAHTRFADEHGVVLGAPLQHLDRAADLVVPPDHRIELSGLGALGEVHRIARQGFASLLGIGIGDRLAASCLPQCPLEGSGVEAGFVEQAASLASHLHQRQQRHLGRDEVVPPPRRLALGQVQHPPQGPASG